MRSFRSVVLAQVALWSMTLAGSALANGTCPPERAKSVEEQLAEIRSWAGLVTLYKEFGTCDTSALSYGFTQTVARLAAQPGGIAELALEVRKNPALKRTVLRHLRSEAIAQPDIDRIIANVHQECPTSRKTTQLCRSVLQAVSH